jgi:hypothetical protein
VALLSDYSGHMLNHVETLYQRGERELAIALFEALGCQVVDTETPCETGATILYVFPEAREQDRLNNVVYLSEIRDQQWDLEQALQERLTGDSQLSDALERYKTKARTAPHGITHFGLRYPSFASLERVIDRLTDQLDPRLEGRVAVDPIRPGDARSMTDELIQAFVTTDVISAGLFTFGQLIELQAQELEV